MLPWSLVRLAQLLHVGICYFSWTFEQINIWYDMMILVFYIHVRQSIGLVDVRDGGWSDSRQKDNMGCYAIMCHNAVCSFSIQEYLEKTTYYVLMSLRPSCNCCATSFIADVQTSTMWKFAIQDFYCIVVVLSLYMYIIVILNSIRYLFIQVTTTVSK